MKIFISQPMRGRNDDEIKAERAELMAAVREQYGHTEELDTFFDNPEWGSTYVLGKEYRSIKPG